MDEYRDPYDAQENATQNQSDQNYDNEYQYDDRIPPEPDKKNQKMPGAIKLVFVLHWSYWSLYLLQWQ